MQVRNEPCVSRVPMDGSTMRREVESCEARFVCDAHTIPKIVASGANYISDPLLVILCRTTRTNVRKITKKQNISSHTQLSVLFPSCHTTTLALFSVPWRFTDRQ